MHTLPFPASPPGAESSFVGRHFQRSTFSIESLQDELTLARALRDIPREMRAQHLIATAAGRYDFSEPNLSQLVGVHPERFKDWLARAWSVSSSAATS